MEAAGVLIFTGGLDDACLAVVDVADDQAAAAVDGEDRRGPRAAAGGATFCGSSPWFAPPRVLAWSRFRFVRFTGDERAETTFRLLEQCFETLSGVQGTVPADGLPEGSGGRRRGGAHRRRTGSVTAGPDRGGRRHIRACGNALGILDRVGRSPTRSDGDCPARHCWVANPADGAGHQTTGAVDRMAAHSDRRRLGWVGRVRRAVAVRQLVARRRVGPRDPADVSLTGTPRVKRCVSASIAEWRASSRHVRYLTAPVEADQLDEQSRHYRALVPDDERASFRPRMTRRRAALRVGSDERQS
jgi:hypothetical protein